MPHISVNVDQNAITADCGRAFTITGEITADHDTDITVCATLPEDNRCTFASVANSLSVCTEKIHVAAFASARFSLSLTIDCDQPGQTYFSTLAIVATDDDNCQDTTTITLTARC